MSSHAPPKGKYDKHLALRNCEYILLKILIGLQTHRILYGRKSMAHPFYLFHVTIVDAYANFFPMASNV